MADATYQPKVYRKQGGAEFVVASSGAVTVESGGQIDLESGGRLDVESGGYIPISSGGQMAIPVTSSTSNDAPIPNYGLCVIRAAAATASDCREVAAPTRAGLVLHLVANCAATGVNVCVASGTSLADIIIRDQSGTEKPIWQLGKASTQKVTLVSANTSEWYVTGPVAGTFSTAGST